MFGWLIRWFRRKQGALNPFQLLRRWYLRRKRTVVPFGPVIPSNTVIPARTVVQSKRETTSIPEAYTKVIPLQAANPSRTVPPSKTSVPQKAETIPQAYTQVTPPKAVSPSKIVFPSKTKPTAKASTQAHKNPKAHTGVYKKKKVPRHPSKVDTKVIIWCGNRPFVLQAQADFELSITPTFPVQEGRYYQAGGGWYPECRKW